MSARIAAAARACCLALCALGLLAAGAAAQEGSLPADMQVALIGKVMRFDRKIDRFGNPVVLGFLYQAGNRQSDRAAHDLSEAAQAMGSIGSGHQGVRAVLLPYTARTDLRSELRRQGISLLYLTPMRAVDLARLVEEAHEAGVLTVAGDAEPIRAGAAIGFKERGPRAAVSIRLGSSRKAGSDFESALLRLVDVQP